MDKILLLSKNIITLKAQTWTAVSDMLGFDPFYHCHDSAHVCSINMLFHHHDLVVISAVFSFFLSRNPCIQIFYGFLVSGCAAIYTYRVVPYFGKMNIFSVLTYFLIAINVTLFWRCSRTDPGVITQLTHTQYVNQYEPDGLYYTSKKCHTCTLIKPARSKHCCKYTVTVILL